MAEYNIVPHSSKLGLKDLVRGASQPKPETKPETEPVVSEPAETKELTDGQASS